MRERIGNPHDEQHKQTLRCLDWVAPAGTDPATVTLAAETALGVKLRADSGTAHGFITTSRRPDGALYVAVHLYQFSCTGTGCTHPGLQLAQGTVSAAALTALVQAVGEHPTHKLTGGPGDDGVLSALGYRTTDPPRRQNNGTP